jgi:hypothetical protein
MFGHAMITLPALMIMFGTGLGVYILAGRFLLGSDIALLAASLGVVAAVVPAWAWWHHGVRRWRRWTAVQSIDPDRTERLAVRTLLVWPDRRFEGQVPGE